jgi:hypothetical protein
MFGRHQVEQKEDGKEDEKHYDDLVDEHFRLMFFPSKELLRLIVS